MSYSELFDRARSAAGGLREAGVRRGDEVRLSLALSSDQAVMLHACLLLGAIAVPHPEGLRELPEGASLAEPSFHDLDAPAITVRTSGTTSEPKEVELTYGNWLWSALGSAAALGHPSDERWLCALPLTHVGGLSILTRSVIAGTTVLLHDRWSTEAVLFATDDATIVSLVPTTLSRRSTGVWSTRSCRSTSSRRRPYAGAATCSP